MIQCRRIICSVTSHCHYFTFLLEQLRQLRQLSFQGFRAKLMKHLAQELEVNGAHRLNLGCTEVKLLLLLFNAR